MATRISKQCSENTAAFNFAPSPRLCLSGHYSTEMKPDFQLLTKQVRRNMSKLPDCDANGLFTSEIVEASLCRAEAFPESAHTRKDRSSSSRFSLLHALAITAAAVQAWMQRFSSETSSSSMLRKKAKARIWLDNMLWVTGPPSMKKVEWRSAASSESQCAPAKLGF